MASSEIALRTEPSVVMLTETQLSFIAKTEFVPAGLRGNLPAIMACVATGRALGVADMTALRSIHIIDGKATFSAELMVQLVRAHGHSITGEVGSGAATVRGRRSDNGDEMQSTWTLEMADRAGLLNKQNWKRYPEAMLWARAASQLCRMLFADCFAGSTYTPEEIDDAEIIAFGEEPAEPTSVAKPAAAQEAAAPAAADEAGAPPSPPASSDPDLATAAQQTLIVTKASQAGLDDDARHALVERVTGQPSSKLVPKALVNAVLDEIAKVGVS